MAVEPHHIRRSAVVMRSNALAATPWVAVLPFTTDLDTDMPQWVRVEPTPENGLRQRSRVMCDWPQTVWGARIQTVTGMLDAATMTQVTALLTAALGAGETDA